MKPQAEKLKLTIELVSSTVWFSSIYQIYKQNNRLSEWRRIKENLYTNMLKVV